MKPKEKPSLAWRPPDYEVDDEGKVIGYENDHQPNNWGKWGEFDERGTANFITSDSIIAASKLIISGRVISCAIPLESGGPVHPSRTPILHLFQYTGTDMVSGSELGRRFPGYQGSDDYLVMPVQGSTQWDGLAHIGSDDTIYNGFWLGNVEARFGAKRCGIDHLKESLVGRGILLDLPRFLGVERLTPGHAITAEELNACARFHKVELERGDLVLIRTGHLPWYYELKNKQEFWKSASPGLAADCAQWAADSEMAAIAMDNVGIEVEPFAKGGQIYPLHVRLIRDLGLTLGEMWWLEDLSEACLQEGRYKFFLSAPPLRIVNGSGSMINPIAVL